MVPTITKISPFKICGKQIRTDNQSEMNTETAKIGNAWSDFLNNDVASKIPAQNNSGVIYGLYSDYESDETGKYNLTIGAETEKEIETGELKSVDIKGGKYLVFPVEGELPKAIFKTWVKIYEYFNNGTAYKRAFTHDFEKYVGMDCNIYIAVD